MKETPQQVEHPFQVAIGEFNVIAMKLFEQQMRNIAGFISDAELDDQYVIYANKRDVVLAELATQIAEDSTKSNLHDAAKLVNKTYTELGEIPDGLAFSFLTATGINEHLIQCRPATDDGMLLQWNDPMKDLLKSCIKISLN